MRVVAHQFRINVLLVDRVAEIGCLKPASLIVGWCLAGDEAVKFDMGKKKRVVHHITINQQPSKVSSVCFRA